MELFKKIKSTVMEIQARSEAAGEKAGKKYIDQYVFSKNTPENSLEFQLITDLVEAQELFDSISNLKRKEKSQAKEALNRVATKVLEAHKKFIERGGKYITPDGKEIN